MTRRIDRPTDRTPPALTSEAKPGPEPKQQSEQLPAPLPALTPQSVSAGTSSPGHTKAAGPMVLIILSLCIAVFLLGIRYYHNNDYLLGHYFSMDDLLLGQSLLSSLILMLIGTINDSRGKTIFGVGLLLFALVMIGSPLPIDSNIISLGLHVISGAGSAMAGIGCLKLRKGLKANGSILMLVGQGFHLFAVISGIAKGPLFYTTGILVCIFVGVATNPFPIREPEGRKNDSMKG